jgi:putative tryptophan/tyrosine transport system substrate-binding protein
MRRREFITLLGGAAVWPMPARAQQSTLPVVGFISGVAADTGRAAVFRKGLAEAGFTENRNVLVDYHWLGGHYERLPTVLDDLVRRRVTVIVTPGTSDGARAARAATRTIPIVFSVGEDPVALGLVASLARPGGNATGINFFSFEVNAKRLELMHELLPKATRYAVLVNPANAASTEATSKALKEAANHLGLELHFFSASSPAEIDEAFAAFARERVEAIFVAADALFASRGVQFATLAVRERLPSSFNLREMVQAGMLMSYGASVDDMYGQVGVYTGKILNGTRPADLPVLQSTRFELVINAQTARSLGIDIPPTLLARADEVIE